MANEFAGIPVHSAEYFGDTRDHWYTPDFLALVAARWRLAEVRTVLDVGCGAGHWGRVLARVLPQEATVIGVDREAPWVEKAADRAVDARFTFVAGRAEALPFPDAHFDLVTCQTVLIHCPDPAAVLAEMRRVCRPGGRIAVAEPSNLANALLGPLAQTAPAEDVLALVGLHLRCERGKTALGEGSISVGEHLPGLFAAAGLSDLQVFQNDRTFTLVPPYASAAERAGVEELEAFAARELWLWSRDETERYHRAGGGDPSAFAALWELAGRHYRTMVAGVRAGTWAQAGGSVMYLVSGVR